MLHQYAAILKYIMTTMKALGGEDRLLTNCRGAKDEFASVFFTP